MSSSIPKPGKLNLPDYNNLPPNSPISPLSPQSSKMDTMANFYESENREILSIHDLKYQLQTSFQDFLPDLTDQSLDHLWHYHQVPWGLYTRLMGYVTRRESKEKNKSCPICHLRPSQV